MPQSMGTASPFNIKAESFTLRNFDQIEVAELLDQLSGYLERLGLERGTLVVFDRRPDAPPLPDRTGRTEVEHKARSISVVRA